MEYVSIIGMVFSAWFVCFVGFGWCWVLRVGGWSLSRASGLGGVCSLFGCSGTVVLGEHLAFWQSPRFVFFYRKNNHFTLQSHSSPLPVLPYHVAFGDGDGWSITCTPTVNLPSSQPANHNPPLCNPPPAVKRIETSQHPEAHLKLLSTAPNTEPTPITIPTTLPPPN